MWMIFFVVELSAVWNGGLPSWKYPRNFESPNVSSPSFGKDSKMMVIRRISPVWSSQHSHRLEFSQACMGHACLMNRSPSTTSYMFSGISESSVDAWRNISQNQIGNLILSMPRRSMDCIVSSGSYQACNIGFCK
ncbi:DDE_3 domain-containing protein [Trichonephila clavipes]|nr:DDE_3 domain-containing protein [Trichonephila clavipes]